MHPDGLQRFSEMCSGKGFPSDSKACPNHEKNRNNPVPSPLLCFALRWQTTIGAAYNAQPKPSRKQQWPQSPAEPEIETCPAQPTPSDLLLLLLGEHYSDISRVSGESGGSSGMDEDEEQEDEEEAGAGDRDEGGEKDEEEEEEKEEKEAAAAAAGGRGRGEEVASSADGGGGPGAGVGSVGESSDRSAPPVWSGRLLRRVRPEPSGDAALPRAPEKIAAGKRKRDVDAANKPARKSINGRYRKERRSRSVNNTASSTSRSNDMENEIFSEVPLRCVAGEFAVFPTPRDSSVPFLVGKVLRKRLVPRSDDKAVGGKSARTEIVVHWFTPKTAAGASSSTIPKSTAVTTAANGSPPNADGGSGGGGTGSGDEGGDAGGSCAENDVVDGSGHRGGGGPSGGDTSGVVGWGIKGSDDAASIVGALSSLPTAAAKAAAMAVASYGSGGWSGVLLPTDPKKKCLVRDIGVEDLAAATVVFPRLLKSNGGLPAGVREAVKKAAVAAALAAAAESRESEEAQEVQHKETVSPGGNAGRGKGEAGDLSGQGGAAESEGKGEEDEVLLGEENSEDDFEDGAIEKMRAIAARYSCLE